MTNNVFLVIRESENGYEYFGIFTTHELATKEAEKHNGASVVMVEVNRPIIF